MQLARTATKKSWVSDMQLCFPVMRRRFFFFVSLCTQITTSAVYLVLLLWTPLFLAAEVDPTGEIS